MNSKQSEISEEMYKRIYRLIKRQVDPRLIANTVNVPVKTIEGIITRLQNTTNNDSLFTSSDQVDSTDGSSEKGFLDIYFYSKTRYAIIQIVGTLTSSFLEVFSTELDKAFESSLKVIAIRMTDVTLIDEESAKIILNYHEKFQSHSRYLALLDPNEALEELLVKYQLEGIVPIFGTERAFEDAAFSRRTTVIKRTLQ